MLAMETIQWRLQWKHVDSTCRVCYIVYTLRHIHVHTYIHTYIQRHSLTIATTILLPLLPHVLIVNRASDHFFTM